MEVFIPPYTRNSAFRKNGMVLILKKINYYLQYAAAIAYLTKNMKPGKLRAKQCTVCYQPYRRL